MRQEINDSDDVLVNGQLEKTHTPSDTQRFSQVLSIRKQKLRFSPPLMPFTIPIHTHFQQAHSVLTIPFWSNPWVHPFCYTCSAFLLTIFNQTSKIIWETNKHGSKVPLKMMDLVMTLTSVYSRVLAALSGAGSENIILKGKNILASWPAFLPHLPLLCYHFSGSFLGSSGCSQHHSGTLTWWLCTLILTFLRSCKRSHLEPSETDWQKPAPCRIPPLHRDTS